MYAEIISSSVDGEPVSIDPDYGSVCGPYCRNGTRAQDGPAGSTGYYHTNDCIRRPAKTNIFQAYTSALVGSLAPLSFCHQGRQLTGFHTPSYFFL